MSPLDTHMRSLANTLRGLETVADKANPRWRHDMIALRRRLSDDINHVATAIPTDMPNAQLFRDALSRFRLQVALMQTDHPASGLNPDDPVYRKHIAEVGIAARALFTEYRNDQR